MTFRIKQFFAAVGVLLICLSMTAFSAFIRQKNIERQARYDSLTNAITIGESCIVEIRSIDVPERRPVVGSTVVVAVTYLNTSRKYCKTELDLSAAGFDRDPKDAVKINAKPGWGEYKWTVAAKQPGAHHTLVQNETNSASAGVVILANSYFTSSNMLLISAILAFIGPAATLPWLIEKLNGLRKRRNKKKELLHDK